MGDVLVGSHNHDRTRRPVDSAQLEDVVAGLQVGAEDLLVVDEPVAALVRPQDARQLPDGDAVVWLLEDGSQVDDCVDVRPAGGSAAGVTVGPLRATRRKRRGVSLVRSWSFMRRRRRGASGRRPCPRDPGASASHRRRAPRAPSGIASRSRTRWRGADPCGHRRDGRAVMRRRAGREAPMLLEVALELLRVDAVLAVRRPRTVAEHLRPTRGRSRSTPAPRPGAPTSRCAAVSGRHCSRSTAASFQPRLKASCIEKFMPCPAFGLCVWQASPAMNTRGRREPVVTSAERRRTCRRCAGRSRTRPPRHLLHLQRVGMQDAPRRGDQLLDRDAAAGDPLVVAQLVHLDVQAHQVAALARDHEQVALAADWTAALQRMSGKVGHGQHSPSRPRPGWPSRRASCAADGVAHRAAGAVAADHVAGPHRLDLAGVAGVRRASRTVTGVPSPARGRLVRSTKRRA